VTKSARMGGKRALVSTDKLTAGTAMEGPATAKQEHW
jgi:hypothetical protein